MYRLKTIYSFLVKSYYTLSGWRFHDLKEFIRLNKNQEVSSNRADLLLVLDTALACRQQSDVKNALLSSMPPEATGVATCNLKSVVEGKVDVDVFADWRSVNDFAVFEAMSNAAVAGYSFSSLPLFAVRRKYKNLVVSIGNSDHNVFAVLALTKFDYRSVCENVILHLHDGCLLNVAEKLLTLNGKSLLDGVLASYLHCDTAELTNFAQTCTERWRLVEGLVERRIFGLKIIIEMIRPTKVVTNSAFAADMVRSDYGEEGCPIPIDVAFHPIFASDVRCFPYNKWSKERTLKVGSFGIPSESKQTSRVISACHELKNLGISVKLILAGFSVETYVERFGHLIRDLEVECHSDVSDDALLEIMDSVHIAVQLRKRNLGESSGVIASLVKKNVPTIVTGTGTFKEYQYSCTLVGEDVTPSELAVSILGIVQGNELEVIKKLQENYTEDHSPKKLCELLFA